MVAFARKSSSEVLTCHSTTRRHKGGSGEYKRVLCLTARTLNLLEVLDMLKTAKDDEVPPAIYQKRQELIRSRNYSQSRMVMVLRADCADVEGGQGLV